MYVNNKCFVLYLLFFLFLFYLCLYFYFFCLFLSLLLCFESWNAGSLYACTRLLCELFIVRIAKASCVLLCNINVKIFVSFVLPMCLRVCVFICLFVCVWVYAFLFSFSVFVVVVVVVDVSFSFCHRFGGLQITVHTTHYLQMALCMTAILLPVIHSEACLICV